MPWRLLAGKATRAGEAGGPEPRPCPSPPSQGPPELRRPWWQLESLLLQVPSPELIRGSRFSSLQK